LTDDDIRIIQGVFAGEAKTIYAAISRVEGKVDALKDKTAEDAKQVAVAIVERARVIAHDVTEQAKEVARDVVNAALDEHGSDCPLKEEVATIKLTIANKTGVTEGIRWTLGKVVAAVAFVIVTGGSLIDLGLRLFTTKNP
jgi:hypothetical protein